MTISNANEYLAARANRRQGLTFQRASLANQVAGGLCSMWRSTGPVPTQGVIPAAAALCNKATVGALANFNNNAGGSDTTYLDILYGNLATAGGLALYDRLMHSGGLNGTLTTAQAVNTQTVLTLPIRDTVAAECEWWLECYAALGATSVTATVAVTYTDSSTANLSVTIPSNWNVGRLLPIIPASGRVIASVQTVTLSGTTGAAGNFGVTCGDRFAGCELAMPGGIPPPPREGVMVAVPNDACLWHVVECSTTSTGDVRGSMTLIQG